MGWLCLLFARLQPPGFDPRPFHVLSPRCLLMPGGRYFFPLCFHFFWIRIIFCCSLDKTSDLDPNLTALCFKIYFLYRKVFLKFRCEIKYCIWLPAWIRIWKIFIPDLNKKLMLGPQHSLYQWERKSVFIIIISMLVAEEDALEMLICCNKILHNVRAREYQVSPTLAWGGGTIWLLPH